MSGRGNFEKVCGEFIVQWGLGVDYGGGGA